MKKTLLISLAVLEAMLVLPEAMGAEVKENWDKICETPRPRWKGRHQNGGKLSIKNLTDAKVQGEFTDDQAFKAVKEGIKDTEGKIKMKPVEGLSDADIKGLVVQVLYAEEIALFEHLPRVSGVYSTHPPIAPRAGVSVCRLETLECVFIETNPATNAKRSTTYV